MGSKRALTAPGPARVIPRGLFTVNFLAQLLTWKYVWGVPLHRLRKQMATQGAAMAAGSLVGALEKLVPVLEPLYEAIKAFNRHEPWWHADETHWKVFLEQVGKVGYRWWLWVFSGPQSTVYLLSPTRSAQVPKDHLQKMSPDDENLPSWFGKLLLTDYYAGYRAMFLGILHAWCWAHIRRKFFNVGHAVPALQPWSQAWLDRIRHLYALHAARAAAEADSATWQVADQKLRTWVQTMSEAWQKELKKPHLAVRASDVLATVQRQWEGLTLFLDHPEIPLDNNEAERLLRTPVVGRKNYYGSRAEWSGHLAAMVWTLWATAAQNGHNPMTYVTDYLTAYAENGSQPLSEVALAAFLPSAEPPAETNDTG